MRGNTDAALTNPRPGQMDEQLLRHIAELAAPRASQSVNVPWAVVARDWLRLGSDANSCRIAYGVLSRLRSRGLVLADFDWYGVSWIEVVIGGAAVEQSLREIWQSSTNEWVKQEVTVNIFGNVGNVNTGVVLGNMEANLQQLTRAGHADLAADLQQLVQAVVATDALPEDRKKEVLQQVAILGEQAAAGTEERKIGAVKAIVSALRESLAVSGSLASLWSVLGPKLIAFFGL